MLELLTDSRSGHYIETFLQQQELNDETSLLQLGQHDIVEYQDLVFGEPQSTVFDDWPTPENPNGDYKIVGLWIELS